MKKLLLFLSLFFFLQSNSFAQQDANFPRRSALIYSTLPGGIPTSYLNRSYNGFLSFSTEQQWTRDKKAGFENQFFNFEQLSTEGGKASRLAYGFHAINQYTKPLKTTSLHPRITLRRRIGRSLSEGGISVGLQPGLIFQTTERATFKPFHIGDKTLLNTRRERIKGNFSVGVSFHRKIKRKGFKKDDNREDVISGGYSQVAFHSFNLSKDLPLEASTEQIPHHYLHFTYIAKLNSYSYLQTQFLYSWIKVRPAQLNISTRYYRALSTTEVEDSWAVWLGGNWTRSSFPTWGFDVGIAMDQTNILMLGVGWEQINIARREALHSLNLSIVYAWKKKEKEKRS